MGSFFGRREYFAAGRSCRLRRGEPPRAFCCGLAFFRAASSPLVKYQNNTPHKAGERGAFLDRWESFAAGRSWRLRRGEPPRVFCFGLAFFRAASSPLVKYQNNTPHKAGCCFGTPGGNRTHNGPLGGGCYIHLTTEVCLKMRKKSIASRTYLYYTICMKNARIFGAACADCQNSNPVFTFIG